MSWSYDADESIPFPQGAPKGQTAVTVAGARRSGRTHRPSQRVLEAAAASSSGSGEHSGAKRKAPSTSVIRDAKVQSRTLVRTLNPRTEPKVQVQFSSGSPSCVQVQF